MKKLMGISVIAALAVLPMAANAARTVQTGGEAGAGSATALASQSYVNGAYNAMNTKVDAVITDSAVTGENHVNITAGNSVAENLAQLDTAIQTLSSGTTSTIEALDANVSNTVGGDGLSLTVVEEDGVITSVSGSIATNTYQDYDDSTVSAETAQKTYTAITAGNGVGANLEALDSHVKTAETNIGTMANLDTTATNLVGAINEVKTAVSTLTGDASSTYQTKTDSTVATGTNYLTAGTGVGANLTVLDTQVATINAKQIPIVSDWANQNTVTYTAISALTSGN